jgi:hypothetical protein
LYKVTLGADSVEEVIVPLAEDGTGYPVAVGLLVVATTTVVVLTESEMVDETVKVLVTGAMTVEINETVEDDSILMFPSAELRADGSDVVEEAVWVGRGDAIGVADATREVAGETMDEEPGDIVEVTGTIKGEVLFAGQVLQAMQTIGLLPVSKIS